MADVTDFSARRWDAVDDPAKHDVAEALRAAMRALENDEKPPEHIIVAFGRNTEDGSSATRFFQAGGYQYHAQMGLLYEAAQMIRESNG